MTFATAASGRKTPRGYLRRLCLWGDVLRAVLRAPSVRSSG